MSLFETIKTVLFSPKNGWLKFNESKTHMQVLTSYLIPLTIIAVILAFIGHGVIDSLWNHWFSGKRMLIQGIRYSVLFGVVLIGGAYLTTVLIDAIFAGVFKIEKNFNKTFEFVAYSFTPIALATICFIIPFCGWIHYFAVLYGFVLLMFAQMSRVQNLEIPNGKKWGYALASMGMMVVAYWTVYGIFYWILATNSVIYYF